MGLTAVCPVWREMGREVLVLWGGESCWAHLLAGQLILPRLSPDQPVSSNIIIN